MKLFDVRSNAIRTLAFALMFKQVSSASNIDFSDILENLHILLLWYIKPPKTVLDLMHLKKARTDASVY